MTAADYERLKADEIALLQNSALPIDILTVTTEPGMMRPTMLEKVYRSQILEIIAKKVRCEPCFRWAGESNTAGRVAQDGTARHMYEKARF